ncbi:KES1-like protein [Fusarium heterosporum]|uniref:KES1-like protein n=1 Tax=Fusarium heterosporum TaxID=42747 RepID=A0A8H5TDX0_FUSHE|nr:KES1-like protein [Fusarium heterosporum]
MNPTDQSQQKTESLASKSPSPTTSSPSPPFSPTSMADIGTESGNLFRLKDVLSYFAAVKGDLSNVTAPPFILAPRSAIEIPAAWACHHDLFLQPADEPDAGVRALLLAKNYVCSLKQLVDADSSDAGKKPLNPFLGELFLGSYSDKAGSQSQLIVEQVSHHPPVTACSIYNKERGIASIGFVGQETSFSLVSGVAVRQTGYAIIKDDKHDEQSVMTMPTILVKGVATGSPYPELEGPSYITSSSGYLTKIEFHGKNRLGFGQKNQVVAEVFAPDNRNKPLYRITGQWTGTLTIEDSSKTTLEEFHVDQIPISPLGVAPIEEQTPWESRRAWWKVTEAIKHHDIEKVYAHKSAIEDSQRRRRLEEEKKDVKWNRLFFSQSAKGDDTAASLLASIPDTIEGMDVTKTNGTWNFIGIEEASKLMSNLRKDTLP